MCPDGWHIPAPAEWEKFLRHVEDKMGSVSIGDLDMMALIGFGEVGVDSSTVYVIKTDTPYVDESSYADFGRWNVLIRIRGRGMDVNKGLPFGNLNYYDRIKGEYTARKLFVRCVKN